MKTNIIDNWYDSLGIKKNNPGIIIRKIDFDFIIR